MRIRPLWLAIAFFLASILGFLILRFVTVFQGNTFNLDNQTTYAISHRVPAAFNRAISEYPKSRTITLTLQELNTAQNLPIIRWEAFGKTYFLDFSFTEEDIGIRMIIDQTWIGHHDELNIEIGRWVQAMLILANSAPSPQGNSLDPNTRELFFKASDSVINNPDYKPEEWQFITRLQ